MNDEDDIIDGEIIDERRPVAVAAAPESYREPAPGASPNADFSYQPPLPRAPRLGDVWENPSGIRLRVLAAPNEAGLHRVLDMRTSASLFADLSVCRLIEAAPEGAELEPDAYEIVIVEVTWTADHTQAHIEFDAINAPNWSFSTVQHPRLTATVDMRADPNRQLTAGRGSDGGEYTGGTTLAVPYMPKGYGALGSAPEIEGAPEMPSEDVILAACRRVLRVHVAKVLDERRRADMRKDAQESLIGKKFKVQI